jgi:hypothetical protein
VVQVVNELFYFAADAPKLAGAEVALRDRFTNDEVFRGSTDGNGRLETPVLASGYYVLDVRANDHENYEGTVFVEPGPDNFRRVFLSQQTVKYTWSIDQANVLDRYRLAVRSTFETNVPIPTVVIDNPVIDLAEVDEVGDDAYKCWTH